MQRYRYTGETHAVASFPWFVDGLPGKDDQPLEPGQEFESDYPINNAIFLRLDEKGKFAGPAVIDAEPEVVPEPVPVGPVPVEPEPPTPLDESAPDAAPVEG